MRFYNNAIRSSEVVNYVNANRDTRGRNYPGERFQGGRFRDGRSRGGRFRGRRVQVDYSSIVCHNCRRKGHIAKDCRFKDTEDEKDIGEKVTNLKTDNKHAKVMDKWQGRRRDREYDGDYGANKVSTDGKAFACDGLQCYFCHERDSHVSENCPNSTVTVQMLNNDYKLNAANNAEADRGNRNKTHRIA